MGLSIFAYKPRVTAGVRLARLDRSASILIASSFKSPPYSTNQIQHLRTFWGWGRQGQRNPWNDNRVWQHLEKLQLQNMSKQSLCRQVLFRSKWRERMSHELPEGEWRWSWRRFGSHDTHDIQKKLQENRDGGSTRWARKWLKDHRARVTRLRSDMDHFKKEIEIDPYEFLFGRSNRWLGYNGSRSNWPTFCVRHDEAPTKRQKIRESSPTSEQKPSTQGCIKNEKIHRPSEVQGKPDVMTETPTELAPEPLLKFDPVSNRMVSPVPQDPNISEGSLQAPESSADIPVKTFKSYRAQFDHPMNLNEEISVSKHENNPENVIHEIAQDSEGTITPLETERADHRRANVDVPYTAGLEKKVGSIPSFQNNEAPMSAFLDSDKTIKDTFGNPGPKITHEAYSPEEIKDDDVDLLRASDIRASYFLGKTKQEIAEEKNSTREVLEQDFDSLKDSESDIDVDMLRSYSQRYGPMQMPRNQADEMHISASNSAESNASTLPALYRVLAYDTSSLQVVIAETASSVFSTEQVLHPAEVLARLNTPAKFLPHFAKTQADGYELVSGGGDILIFKKVRESETPSMTAIPAKPVEQKESDVCEEEVESWVQDHQERFDQSGLSEKSTQPLIPSSPPRMVRRQETVYTGGPPNWSPYPTPPPSPNINKEANARSRERSSFWKTTQWVLMSGLATAGTCYAVGVVCEYFRTGGEDGLGPDGFTAFEAERRQMK